jgi:hypothetical protein
MTNYFIVHAIFFRYETPSMLLNEYLNVVNSCVPLLKKETIIVSEAKCAFKAACLQIPANLHGIFKNVFKIKYCEEIK